MLGMPSQKALEDKGSRFFRLDALAVTQPTVLIPDGHLKRNILSGFTKDSWQKECCLP